MALVQLLVPPAVAVILTTTAPCLPQRRGRPQAAVVRSDRTLYRPRHARPRRTTAPADPGRPSRRVARTVRLFPGSPGLQPPTAATGRRFGPL
ncbi:hypothetical protein SAMN05216371_8042 [Streptomyces sp. TLI_053]|nr:hypothetical protein SAMN05216371_8042 [Streptomyces sp. TLI_053]